MREKKFKVQPSVSKVVASISWDSVEMLVEFLNRSATIHSKQYMQHTTNLKVSAKLEDK